MVFCNAVSGVKRLKSLLTTCRIPFVSALYADMQVKFNPVFYDSKFNFSLSAFQQRQRLKNLDRFRASEFGILVTTDVAARGLDIPNVEQVRL